jgi:hypothetical protein
LSNGREGFHLPALLLLQLLQSMLLQLPEPKVFGFQFLNVALDKAFNGILLDPPRDPIRHCS